VRCAIYTRKSSEEGLEQSFNSLDAQREACEAYVASQVGEGWNAHPSRYDDGGYSGGSMERPGLQRLLADIVLRKVDVVVVYKVDRLTRSLADFARIVDTFDANGVSFVSVTQAFNTTTSMGRLTLNVLLSFAQFEREVTGERIRDKIAASKKKGMWMGGTPPLGYRPHERTLTIDEDEAETVRHIFSRYLEIGSVHELKRELDRDGICSRPYRKKAMPAPFSRGALYHPLEPHLRRRDCSQGRELPRAARANYRARAIRLCTAAAGNEWGEAQRADDCCRPSSACRSHLRCTGSPAVAGLESKTEWSGLPLLRVSRPSAWLSRKR
jgi:DNA invertase Pin-like site-specific DNA recombinase